jgi:DNA primase
MEGYMDVLSGVLYDFDTSIAPLGTALTVEQASLLKRYTANVFLSFDMDKAGVSATERAGLILKEQGFNIRVLQFEGSKDPDEFLKKNGKEAFIEVVKKSQEIFDFLYKTYSSEYDLENPLAKQHFIERFSPFFSVVANPIERETYLKNLSSKTGISFESLFDQLVKNNKENTKHYFQEEIKKEKRKEKQEERFSSQDRESQNLEIAISKLLLLKPKYYKFFDEKMSNGFILKKVFEFFSKKIKEDNDLGSNNIIKDFNIFIEEDNDLTLSEREDILGILNIKCSMENDRDIEDEKNNIETMKSYFRNRRDQEIEKGDLSLQRKHNWNLFFDEINFVFVEENRRVGKKNIKKVRTNMSFDELVIIFEKYKYLFQEN